MMDLKETNDVFANPHTENLHDRQLAVLRRLVHEYQEGFRYSQLDDLCELLMLVWSRVGGGANQFIPQLQELIGLCGLPIIRERSNEEFLGGLECFEHLVSTLEKFLHVPSMTIQIATCEALLEISLGRDILRNNDPPVVRVLGATNPVKEDLRPLPRELHQGLLLKGGVVSGLTNEIQAQVNSLAIILSEANSSFGDKLSDLLEENMLNDTESNENRITGDMNNKSGAQYIEPALLKTTIADYSDDEDDDNGDGKAGGGTVVEVAVKTRALKAELVSSIPRPIRALLGSLMNLLREISGDSNSSSEIVKSNGMSVVIDLLRLLVVEPRDPLIKTCIEVLWNCLEHSQHMLELGAAAVSRTQLVERRRRANAMYALATTEALTTLRDLVAALLKTGHRTEDKELRNEVLIVCSFLARQRRSHAYFRTTGLLDMLLAYATAAENKDFMLSDEANEGGGGGGGGGYEEHGDNYDRYQHDDDEDNIYPINVTSYHLPDLDEDFPLAEARNFATVQPADLEMKRILWALLSDLSKQDTLNLEAVVDSNLLSVLLMYLNADLNLSPLTAFNTVSELNRQYSDDEDDRQFQHQLPGSSGGGAPSSPLSQSSFGSPNGGGGGGGGGVFNKTEQQVKQSMPMVIRRMPRTQLRVLQQQCMSVLLNLAPRAPEKFKLLAGHIITLRFLDACSESSEALSGLVQGSLMLLLSFVGLPGLQEELGQLGAVRIMLARFNDANAPHSLRADAVCILSRLCAGHEVNQAAFRKTGIASLVLQLEAYAKGRQPANRERRGALPPGAFGMSGNATEKVSPLVVGVVDCLWNGVVGNGRSEARLLAVGGMDALLNMLEMCPILMRHQTAGIIADLCENTHIVPYVKAWRSDRTMLSAVELLMRLFEDEEVRLMFDRPGGVITNLWEPLRLHTHPPSTIDHGSSNGGGGDAGGGGNGGGGGGDDGSSVNSSTHKPKSFERLSNALHHSAEYKAERALRKAIETQDLRAKISAIVQRIGFIYAGEGLAAGDRATLLMAEHYVEFRAGESWAQVRRELLVEGTKPIAADSFLLETKIEGVFNRSRRVKCDQMKLVLESVSAANDKEDAFFDTVLLQRDQELRMEQIRRSATQPKSLSKKKKSLIIPNHKSPGTPPGLPSNNNNNNDDDDPMMSLKRNGGDYQMQNGDNVNGENGNEGNRGPQEDIDDENSFNNEYHGIAEEDTIGGVNSLVNEPGLADL
mmetsp:Transcript_44139/g.56561  ORF Transcript_44139/g.56561 Transcript_44139/m.56561 type:complete len:1219 (-) Transcript_44139:172-3828(-)